MGRGTGRAEIVKAAEESIAYQIADVAFAIEQGAGISLNELRADGGPTRDKFLMQFQSDILGLEVVAPEREELSSIGAAYCAGIARGLYGWGILEKQGRARFLPQREAARREHTYDRSNQAVCLLL